MANAQCYIINTIWLLLQWLSIGNTIRDILSIYILLILSILVM